MAMATCHVLSDGAANKPVFFANFTNGRVKHGENIKFQLYQSTKKVKSKEGRKRKLVAETERLQYITDDKTELPQNIQYMVGVYDKKSKVLKLHNAEMHTIKPYNKDDEEEKEEDQALTLRQQADNLTSAFGSSKKKRAMVSRQKNTIREDVLDSAIGSAVNEALSSNTSEEITNPLKAQEASTVIPPYNKEAKRPEDVYSIDDIINSSDREAMLTPAQKFIDSTRDDLLEWRKESKFSLHVLNLLSRLPLAEKERADKSCLLMYLQYMIILHNLKSTELRKKAVPDLPVDIPISVKKYLLEKYTVLMAPDPNRQPVRCIPGRLKDKLVSYIFVLCLILDDFHLEFSQLQKDLKMGQQKALMFLKSLGCKIQTQKIELSGMDKVEVKTATMPIPLIFPEITIRSRKDKR